jgi:hypothetical protein
MAAGHHLSLSLSGEMWNQILRTALPFSIASGELDLAAGLRSAVRQLQVRERVAGLLEDHRTPQPLVQFGKRLGTLWEDRRANVYGMLNDLVRVEGTWTVEVDEVGTDLRYGPQKVAADAWVRGVAEGNITFLREGLTLPYRIEKRVGASVALGRIRYSRDREAVIGNLQDLAIHLGDNAVLQVLARVIEYGLQQKVETLEPVPVLKREQVDGLVGGMGGALRMNMGVDDLQLDIDDEHMTLRVRFGFSRAATERQIGTSG